MQREPDYITGHLAEKRHILDKHVNNGMSEDIASDWMRRQKETPLGREVERIRDGVRAKMARAPKAKRRQRVNRKKLLKIAEILRNG